jgi:hypothetical protein
MHTPMNCNWKIRAVSNGESGRMPTWQGGSKAGHIFFATSVSMHGALNTSCAPRPRVHLDDVWVAHHPHQGCLRLQLLQGNCVQECRRRPRLHLDQDLHCHHAPTPLSQVHAPEAALPDALDDFQRIPRELPHPDVQTCALRSLRERAAATTGQLRGQRASASAPLGAATGYCIQQRIIAQFCLDKMMNGGGGSMLREILTGYNISCNWFYCSCRERITLGATESIIII